MLKNMLQSALNFVNWAGTVISEIKPHNYDNNPCLQDLPTNTKSDWINQQNAKLNKIPMCKARPDE